MDNIKLIMDIMGWIGAGSLLLSYLLISNAKVIGKSYTYQGLNILGSAGILMNTYYYGAMPSVILNTIWLLIGFYTLTKIKEKKCRNLNKTVLH
jgi:formate hydrogenlyase subunit 3/multisubunit Na+/H+ antiporter MnhD subunit